MPDRKPGGKTGEPVDLRNIRLLLAFDGAEYYGWQVQDDRPTIQGHVSDAIEQITGERITPTGSGRTDAGTHARGLVANFFTRSRIPENQIARALNSVLPRDIRVLSARTVPLEFHARCSARSKVYRYQIYRGPVILPHLAHEHYHYPYPLDIESMQQAAERFVGDHDFGSFATSSGEVENTVRRIFASELVSRGRRLLFTVEGSGFLRHMVRNMVGTLLELGRGRMTPDHLLALLSKRDRSHACFTVPAHGLILLKVRY